MQKNVAREEPVIRKNLISPEGKLNGDNEDKKIILSF